MPQIVIASTNPHKIAKIKPILAPYFDEIKSLLDYPELTKVEENASLYNDTK